MADRTAIEWTDASWTPIRARWFEPQNDGGGKERVGWHCEHVSEGCRNCYAEGMNARLGTKLPFKPAHRQRGDVTVFLDEKMLLQPLRWRRPRKIFAGSMTDLFADFVTDQMLDRIFAVMTAAHWHTFQLLTKRPDRMCRYLSDPGLPFRIARAWCFVGRDEKKGWSTTAWLPAGTDSIPRHWPLPNVWAGTSCEDQTAADARVPELLATPAAIRFVSAEPLLSGIDFTLLRGKPIDYPDAPRRAHWIDALTGDHGTFLGASRVVRQDRLGHLDQVIVGGESGPHARPMHLDWARSIRDQCAAAGVAFYFKQNGEFLTTEISAEGALNPVVPIPFLSNHLYRWEGQTAVRVHPKADCKTIFAPGFMSFRVGKKAAGRLLDGVEHNGMPAVAGSAVSA